VQALDNVGNREAPYGSPDWCAAKHLQVHAHIEQAKARVDHVRFDLKAMRDEAHYLYLPDKHGELFQSWEDYCQFPTPWGLGMPVAVAEAIIAERDGTKRISVVAQEVMGRAQPLKANGGDRRSAEAKEQIDNVKLKTDGGNSVDYLAARIKRDRPDIAEAVERGEFPSIRQAAIAAGIVKQTTPLDTLRRAWRRASEEERAAFREEIDTPVMDRTRFA
jgi:hypothetical protein